MSIRKNRNIDDDVRDEDKIDFWDEVGDLIYGYTNVAYRIWWDYARYQQ